MARKSSEPYCPDEGEFIWLEFHPQVGREQAGRRPALVLSPRRYNAFTSLAIVCPVTTRVRGGPYESVIPPGSVTGGVVLTDRLKSLSWAERHAVFIDAAPPALIGDVRARIRTLIGE